MVKSIVAKVRVHAMIALLLGVMFLILHTVASYVVDSYAFSNYWAVLVVLAMGLWFGVAFGILFALIRMDELLWGDKA